ncbi:TetR/AcrR family transcriptional regulator [Sodalis sp. RH21]|uniref:TetR/AcrR family transcriptional regulator n=1 Tax=unclassified Sodalis (in: enterobacteria) TaxID=2636512 RepID=UPI0039B54118
MHKKQDIIQAAERLFYTNGFHATSTDRICREAGVSTRTLYRYFPSREELTEAVMADRKYRFFSMLHHPRHPEAISRLFGVLGQWMREHGASGCFFLKAWGEYAEQDVRLSAQALDYRYALREYITACIRHSHGVDSGALADAIWMLSEGAITSALIIGPEAAIRAGEAAALLIGSAGEWR